MLKIRILNEKIVTKNEPESPTLKNIRRTQPAYFVITHEQLNE